MPDIEINPSPGVAVAAWVCSTIIIIAIIAAYALPWRTWGTSTCPPVAAEKPAPR